jgi:hypothetical protein
LNALVCRYSDEERDCFDRGIRKAKEVNDLRFSVSDDSIGLHTLEFFFVYLGTVRETVMSIKARQQGNDWVTKPNYYFLILLSYPLSLIVSIDHDF